MNRAVPFGSQQALFAHNASIARAPTTQDIAIVVCGGGDPLSEYEQAAEACEAVGRRFVVLAGNDQLGEFPHPIDYACTLHPEKLPRWRASRLAHGKQWPTRIWSHRPYNNVTDFTRDWQGSTGLFCVKVAREHGHTHIVLCGVPMTVEAEHFVRHERWNACHGFRRGWTGRIEELKRYVRSYSGWTREQLGAPDAQWLSEDIEDQHAQIVKKGLKA